MIQNQASTLEEELKMGENISATRLVDILLDHAYFLSASDLHLHPREDFILVRMRIDGLLRDTFSLPKTLHSEIISRVKVLSLLRTDVHHYAQDGRFQIMMTDGERINVRVSIVPTYHGENAILRILPDKGESFTLNNLGFSIADRRKIDNVLGHQSGMILATGPTGSGKTTTLYSLLKEINTKEISVVTIEDPIEYGIAGLTQIQVQPQGGITFATGLRSILRQDPDVIMVGEIRDEETARISVNAALTGHLLFSTLHTNNAASTIVRLLDMLVEPYLIASTVSLAIGERLVRRICGSCRRKKPLSGEEKKALSEIFGGFPIDTSEAWVGEGCENCNGSGYKGRMMVCEVLTLDRDIRHAILHGASVGEIEKLAVERGMVPMLKDGAEKALLGLTTFEEILPIAYE